MNGNGPQTIPSIDELIGNPSKVATVPPEAAQTLLIGLASIQALLVQRALLGATNGQGDSGLLTVKDVAQRLKVSEYRAYELVRQGEIKKTPVGGKLVRVRPSDLAAYLAQQGT